MINSPVDRGSPPAEWPAPVAARGATSTAAAGTAATPPWRARHHRRGAGWPRRGHVGRLAPAGLSDAFFSGKKTEKPWKPRGKPWKNYGKTLQNHGRTMEDPPCLQTWGFPDVSNKFWGLKNLLRELGRATGRK